MDETQSGERPQNILASRIRSAVGEWPELAKGTQFLFIRLIFVHGNDLRFVVPVSPSAVEALTLKIPNLRFRSGCEYRNKDGRFDLWNNDPFSAWVVLTQKPSEILGFLDIGRLSVNTYVTISNRELDDILVKDVIDAGGIDFTTIKRILLSVLQESPQQLSTYDGTAKCKQS